MSSSSPQTPASNLGLLKRAGEATLQERSSKRQRQGVESIPGSSVGHAGPYDPLDTHRVSVDSAQLCQKCRKFDLGRMLTEETKAKSIGFLDSFNNPHCQLCDTIRHFVKLHWGFEWPSAINGRRPRVHMQSKTWCCFSDSGLQQTVYRIVLAVDQRPPDLKRMKRALKSEGKHKFVLTELELDPARLENTTSVPSLRRPISPCVDFEVVKIWLQECRDHEACNDSRMSQQSNMVELFASGFRLIDVIEGKLVEKTDPCEYIALSYVWGRLEPPPLRTNKQNLSALQEPSSLYPLKEDQSPMDQIPRTIADTIALCRSIGQRYLWVDSICIVQDDLDEKRRLIHGMDRVYENASLTVMALSGSDAAAGLAGITHRSQNIDNDGRQHLFHKGHRTHCIGIGRISVEEHIRSSHWSTRGWTYQEQLLSPRKLYFSSNEVFYECGCGTRREGYKFEEKTKSNLSVREGPPWYGRNSYTDPTDDGSHYNALPETLPETPPETLPKSWRIQPHSEKFRILVSIYTRKNLTDPGDILNALTGIYHKFYNNAGIQDLGINALQGISMQCFFSTLLWFTPSGHHERRSIVNGFRPSTWSWTSFTAPIDFASARDASFPASVRSFGHMGGYSLVDEFCLYFQRGDNINKIRIFSRQFYHKPNPTVLTESLISSDELLKLFSAKDYGALPALSSVSPGVLEFLGPYIPTPTVASSRWFKTTEGEWQLSFEGKSIRGFDDANDTVLVVKLDPGEDTTDGFVLLNNDSNYFGLCVKKRGEYFERVGLVIFPRYRDAWQTMVGEGLLDLSWKHILLH